MRALARVDQVSKLRGREWKIRRGTFAPAAAVQKLAKDINRAFDARVCARVATRVGITPAAHPLSCVTSLSLVFANFYIPTIFRRGRPSRYDTTDRFRAKAPSRKRSSFHHCGLSQSAKCHTPVSKGLPAEISGTPIKLSPPFRYSNN